ncbi:MAG: hypothetical protein EB100_06865, partial [Crocinitomicaceae bacterium]|nr:hypothetical protein [Crocinitomicaceae bacterium]
MKFVLQLIFRVLLIDLLLLCIPFFAHFFSTEINWSFSDFFIMGILIFIFGSAVYIILMKVEKRWKKLMMLFILLFFIYLWAELAVGIFNF